METRREFLQKIAHASGGLALGIAVPTIAPTIAHAIPRDASTARPEPSLFIRIGDDDTVELISKHLEMGQGVLTGLATIVADELGASWSQMRYRFAPADTAKYKNLRHGIQGTGGSTSMSESWPQLREAAATCREMLVAAAAAHWRVRTETLSVVDGIVRHPRRGMLTFGQLSRSAARRPIPHAVALRDPTARPSASRPETTRLDTAGKIDGTALFGFDVRLPDMVRAVVARPPRFGGRVKSFDDRDARRVPGVVDIVAVSTGVAVIASGSWAAIRGRDALRIEWDEESAERRSSSEIIASFHATSHDAGRIVRRAGDVNAALARAAQQLSAEYEVPLLAHATLEPLNVTVQLRDDGATLWGSFQIPTLDQAAAAAALGIAPSAVELRNHLAGGSFGRRTNSHYVTEACEVAKAWGKKQPLQLLWTREDDIRGGYYRPHFVHRLRAGLDAQGHLVAWRQQVIGPSIVAGSPMEGMMRDGVDPTSVDGAANPIYAVDDAEVALVTPPNRIPLLAWRSVGHTHTGFAIECFIDELAAAAQTDALAFRLAHLGERDDLRRVLTLAAEKSSWNTPLPRGRGRGIAVREAFRTRVAQVAEVTVDGDGQIAVDRIICAVDCGIAINPRTIAAQIEGGIAFGLSAALRGAITLQGGRVEQSNYHDYAPLRITEMPRVEVHIVPSAAPPTGVGELGVPCIAPAVANAVFAATGQRRRTLPLNR